MFGIHDLPLFVASGLLLNLTPGADTLYIVSRSASHGVRAGVAAALGIGAGCLFHVLAAALGLSAILAASSAAFATVRIVGALYLAYVGLSLIRGSFSGLRSASTPPVAPLRTVFAQGMLTNVLNPKVALFFLAFLPQFVDAASPAKSLAFLTLGTIFAFNGTLWCLLLAGASARLGRADVGRGASAWFARGVGVVFIVLGLRLAFVPPG